MQKVDFFSNARVSVRVRVRVRVSFSRCEMTTFDEPDGHSDLVCYVHIHSLPISMYVSRSPRRAAGRESRKDCAGRCTASAISHSVGSWRMSVSLVTG